MTNRAIKIMLLIATVPVILTSCISRRVFYEPLEKLGEPGAAVAGQTDAPQNSHDVPLDERSLSQAHQDYLSQLALAEGSDYAAYYESRLLDSIGIKESVDIVMLGDSLTYQGNWTFLSEELSVVNMGINKDTVGGLEKRLDLVIALRPKAVFLLIGINDLNKFTGDQVMDEYGRLLDRMQREMPNTVLYVQSVLPVRDDIRKIIDNQYIAIINEEIKRMADERGIVYVNLYDPMLDKRDHRLYWEYQTDGLHLTEEGYRAWIEILRPYVRQIEQSVP